MTLTLLLLGVNPLFLEGLHISSLYLFHNTHLNCHFDQEYETNKNLLNNKFNVRVIAINIFI